jgi:hypothetical protein
MSINLSTKTNDFQTFLVNQNITSCLCCHYKTILNKSGVNPGQGASAMVRIEPSISVLLHTHLHEQEYKYHLHDALG